MTVRIEVGDCIEVMRGLPDCLQVHTCVTSPPYFGLRDYGHAGQIGLEPTPDEYVAKMVEVFREVRRVLRDDGTVWLNLGDSYANNGVADPSSVGGFTGERIRAGKKGTMDSRPRKIPEGLKQKDLIGIPWRVAFALQADGWYLRSDIIWHKPNPMPESVTDRPTKAHEYIFLLSKSPRYYYDAAAIYEPAVSEGPRGWNLLNDTEKGPNGGNDRWRGERALDWAEKGRNRRTVWTVATMPFSGAHFATFPPALIEPCILAGCPGGGTVLDPFGGAGTTGLVADRLQRNALLIELNPEYAEMAKHRITGDAPLFAELAYD
jgi:DNA modification methylase